MSFRLAGSRRCGAEAAPFRACVASEGASAWSRVASWPARYHLRRASAGCFSHALGGSWVVISGVISRVTIHIRGLITLLITTHEPPSNRRELLRWGVSSGGGGPSARL